MNDSHYGWVINNHYNQINMLTKMKDKNPQRFQEFQYSTTDIYHYLDELQHQQHIYD